MVALEATNPKDMWLDDINEFIVVYCRHYKVPDYTEAEINLSVTLNIGT